MFPMIISWLAVWAADAEKETGVVATIAGVAGVVVSLSAVVFNLLTVRAQDFERVRALHAELTTGPVMEARQVVGRAYENVTGDVECDLETLDALFTVLWCFERIDVARRSLLWRARIWPAVLNSRRALDDSIRVHVRIYGRYVDRTRVAGERLTLTAGAEDVGIQHLAHELGLTAPGASQAPTDS